MKYAEVAVNSPIAGRRSFSYSIPTQLAVYVGQAVWVPFGSNTLQGIVVEIGDRPSVEATKEIIGVIKPYPLLSPGQVELALWISKYYLSPLFDAIVLMLPPGFERRLVTFFHLVQPSVDLSQLTLKQKQAVSLFQDKNSLSLAELEGKLGKKDAVIVARQLVRRNLVVKSQQLEAVKVRPKLVYYLRLEAGLDEAETEILKLRQARAYKQAMVIEFLVKRAEPAPLIEVKKSVDCQQTVIKSLESRGLVSVMGTEVKREPLAWLNIRSLPSPSLTSPQEKAWQIIRSSLAQSKSDGIASAFLLYGVTGSGKTEIYLRALAEVVARGKRGICLVPEIALTPQIIERFASRFPGRVAVMHSRLSLGERFDEWNRIKDGGCDVVIGPRGALFTPQPDLGLIIIDEEHEWTYKQWDKSPRYQTRDVAVKLAELSGAVVILGSATPDVESYYWGRQGKYQIVEIKERITPRGLSPLPEVVVVDMKKELKAGNRSMFSHPLYSAIADALSHREQVILFLNHRGAAVFVQCRRCGFVPACRRCSVALTYHSVTKRLICHRCGYSCPLPQVCPQCQNLQFKFLGIGTQKVVEEIEHLFPQARTLRWDKDATSRWQTHEELLAKFRDHKADILVGTQMIAKGLDMPQVTLAGIINADTGLNLPDFRAGERTFQLLCQVAGRAGRGLVAGRVIIQTYSPEHYAVVTASRHDYLAFYEQEISYRRQFGYPPFSRLARLVFSHTSVAACQREAEKTSQMIVAEKDRMGISNLKVIGPVPTFVSRVRGHYQWQIVLCGSEVSQFLNSITLPQGWILDIDPVDMV